jgi:hypothetical protein
MAVDLFNGSNSYDQQRGNVDIPATLNGNVTAPLVLTAQGAGTVNGAAQTNVNGRGVILGINTTVDTAGAYAVNLQGFDAVSGTWYTIASSASIAATGFATLTLYPGIAATANVAVSSVLPRTWRVQAVVTTGPITATVGASVIV